MSDATVCQRYRESVTPFVEDMVDKERFNRFGDIPERSLPQCEVRKIYEFVFSHVIQGGTC